MTDVLQKVNSKYKFKENHLNISVKYFSLSVIIVFVSDCN